MGKIHLNFYLVIVLFFVIGLFGFYVYWTNQKEIQSKIDIEKQLQSKLQKEIKIIQDSLTSQADKLKKNNDDLLKELEIEKNKPPIKIPQPYKITVYIDRNDSTIIKSFTKTTNRYREERSKQLDNIK